MSLQNLKEYSRVLQQNQQKNLVEQQKTKLELLKQDNESKKIEMDLFKTINDSELSAVEANKVKTETLGLEEDIKEKKGRFLMDFIESTNLGGLAVGVGRAIKRKSQENTRATQRAREQLKAGSNRASDEDIQAQIQGLQNEAQPPGAQPGAQPGAVPPPAQPPAGPPSIERPEGWDDPLPTMTPVGGGRLDLPPAPERDVGPSIKSLEEANLATQRGIDAREDLFEKQRVITDEFKKGRANYVKSMQRNMALQERLAQNPPSYRSALSNVGWFEKIIGLIDAGMNGHLLDNPTQLLDEMVERELQDQKVAHASVGELLSKQASMYKQFYNLSKDEFEAESSTRAMLYKGVSDQIEGFNKIATNEQQIVGLRALNGDMKRKHAIEEHKLKESMNKRIADQTMKNADLALKKQSQMIKLAKLAQGEPVEKKDQILIGGKWLFMPSTRQKTFRKEMQDSAGIYSGLAEVERLAKGINSKDIIASTKLSGWVSEGGRRSREKVQNINRILRGMAGKARVAIVGPGALSDQERVVLEKYFNVQKEGKFINVIGFKTWSGVTAGDYQALVNVLRKSLERDMEARLYANIDEFKLLPPEERRTIASSELNQKTLMGQ